MPPSWCNWQRPLRLGAGGRFFVGCSHHGKAAYDERGKTKIEFWQYENIDENPNVEDIRVSIFNTNRDALTADQVDGKGILWFNDHKHFLLGREIGPEWFDR